MRVVLRLVRACRVLGVFFVGLWYFKIFTNALHSRIFLSGSNRKIEKLKTLNTRSFNMNPSSKI